MPKRKIKKKKFFYLFFIFLIWLLFFWKFFFKGLLPIPADIITGMYYPWLNHKWGCQVGVPVKNPILSDTVSQLWIWKNWGVDHLKQGKIAIWNPYSLAGYPMSPWFHTALFSPSNIFYFLADNLTAMGLIVCFQILASLVFMFLFLNDLLNNQLAALFGAIAFSFSAFSLGWLTWGTVVWTAAFLPLALFFVNRLIRKSSVFNFFGLFFSILFSLLSGYPQTFFYVFLILLVYFAGLFVTGKLVLARPVFWKISLVFLFSLLASSFVTIPSLEILINSIRVQESYGYVTGFNCGLLSLGKLLILLLAPNFFGSPASGNYWGGGPNYQECLGWFGSSALMLFFLSIIIFWKKRKGKFNKNFLVFGFVFLLAVLLTLKYPVGFLIHKFKIPLFSGVSASRSLFLSTFSGSILAALGLKEFLEKGIKRKQAKQLFLIFIVLLLGLAGGLFLTLLIFKKLSLPEELMLASQFSMNLKVAIRNLILPFFSAGAIVFSILLVSLFSKFQNKRFRFFLAVMFVFVLLVEGFYFGWRQVPFVRKEFYFPETPIINYLKKEYKKKDFFRLEREKAELMPPNMWMAYRFYSSAGYDPIYPSRYANFLKDHLGRGYSRYVEWSRNLEPIDKLGTKYFLVLKRRPDGVASSAGKLPYWVDLSCWDVVFEEGAVALLKNKNFLPPYLLVDKSGERIAGAEIKLSDKSDNYWRFRVKSEQPGTFVLKENFFPGWKVTVDGKEKDVLKINGTFKGVELNPGQHEVYFYYQNRFLKMGLAISLVTFLLSGFVSLCGGFRNEVL